MLLLRRVPPDTVQAPLVPPEASPHERCLRRKKRNSYRQEPKEVKIKLECQLSRVFFKAHVLSIAIFKMPEAQDSAVSRAEVICKILLDLKLRFAQLTQRKLCLELSRCEVTRALRLELQLKAQDSSFEDASSKLMLSRCKLKAQDSSFQDAT
jgi:hypothetical protein